MLYMIQLNLENKIIFSFSCTNVTNTSLCGFYLNENLINFEENKYIKEQINTNIELGYVLQNNSNTIIHYMNYNGIANLIIFLDINNKIENPQILNYENYKEIKCINFNETDFVCILIKDNNDSMKTINIKHFNISSFKYFENINTIDNENPFEIDDKLSFNLSLINNYSFDIYKTDNNILIICFFVKEGNIDKIICYNNTFEEIINSSLEQFPIYKSCDIKKDGKPIFFNYEKISIIYYKKNI